MQSDQAEVIERGRKRMGGYCLFGCRLKLLPLKQAGERALPTLKILLFFFFFLNQPERLSVDPIQENNIKKKPTVKRFT